MLKISVSETLNNCDDGELVFGEFKISESIVLDDNKIKSSSYSSDLGYGLRASNRMKWLLILTRMRYLKILIETI